MKKAFQHVVIAGIHGIIPDECMTSDAIELQLAPLYERLKLPFGRLEGMTGIRSRYFWSKKTSLSKIAAEAARPLIDSYGIDALIYAAVCRERLEPATAAYVHHELGLSSDVLFFDLSSACVGFLNAMYMGAHLIESGQIKRVLIVAAEDGRPLLEHTVKTLLMGQHTRQSIKPYFANLTIGAGACALLMCHKSVVAQDSFWRLKHAVYGVDTRCVHLCEGESHGQQYTMLTQAEDLLAGGLVLSKNTWDKFLTMSELSVEDFSRVLTHQVGRQHQLQLYEALNLPLIKDFSIYETWGNVGSVSVPLTFFEYLKTHPQANGHLAFLGIGSGLTSMMMHVEKIL